MKTLVLYESADPAGRAVKDALTAIEGVEWLSVDASARLPAPCIGCFGCWVKTPGACVLPEDAGSAYYKALAGSDRLVTVSRITWGGLSAAVKSYTDRMLPLLHPDFRIRNGEMHHRLRYGKMPEFMTVGIGGGNEGERQTFRRYSEAQRDQTGLPRGRGCLVLPETGSPGSFSGAAAEAARDWFVKEAGL